MNIDNMVGLTFDSVKNNNDDDLIFSNNDIEFKFHHYQDCCENVEIDDICGDLSDLEGSPILRAEERSSSKDSEYGSETWTFYEFATIKGSVSVKWHGESNGYYSESVDLSVTKKD